MKTAYKLVGSVAVAAILFTGCGGGGSAGSTQISSAVETQSEISERVSNVDVDFQLSSIFEGTNIGKRALRAATLSQGSMTIENLDTGVSTNEKFNMFIDKDTFEISTKKTLVLEPGTYSAQMVIEKDGIQYLGESQFEVVDGESAAPKMTITPIIGEILTDLNVINEVYTTNFKYETDELSSLSNPKIGVIVDGDEQIFSINKATGLTDMRWNISGGEHEIGVNFYDGELQVGKSKLSNYTIDFSQSHLVSIDIIPLNGLSTFSFDVGSSTLNMNFTVPSVLAQETGGVDNLKTQLTVVNNNTTNQYELALSEDGADYSTSVNATDILPGDLSYSLEFFDIEDSEKIGSCNLSTTLEAGTQIKSCDIEIIRRGVAGGSLLNNIGITVYDSQGAKASGAEIYDGSDLIGLTNLDGFLQISLKKGSHQLKAISNGLEGTYDFIGNSVLENYNFDMYLGGAVAIGPKLDWTYDYVVSTNYQQKFLDTDASGALIQDGTKLIKMTNPETILFEKEYVNYWNVEGSILDNGNVAILDKDANKLSVVTDSNNEVGSYEYNSSMSEGSLTFNKEKNKVFLNTIDYSNDLTKIVALSNSGIESINQEVYNESYNLGKFYDENLNQMFSTGYKYISGVGSKYYINLVNLTQGSVESVETSNSVNIMGYSANRETLFYGNDDTVVAYDVVNQIEKWNHHSDSLNSYGAIVTQDQNFLLFDGNYTDYNNKKLVSLNLDTQESCTLSYGTDTNRKITYSREQGVELLTSKSEYIDGSYNYTHTAMFVDPSDCSSVELASVTSDNWNESISFIESNTTSENYVDNNKIYLSEKTSASTNMYELKVFDTDGNELTNTSVGNSNQCDNFIATKTEENTIIYMKDEQIVELDENLAPVWTYNHSVPFQCEGGAEMTVVYDRKEIYVKEDGKLHKINF